MKTYKISTVPGYDSEEPWTLLDIAVTFAESYGWMNEEFDEISELEIGYGIQLTDSIVVTRLS